MMTDSITRRDALKLASMALVATGLGCQDSEALTPDGGASIDADASPLCTRTIAQTAGPFYPGEPEERMNIVGDRVGVSLMLDLQIQASETCEPLIGAEVDVWSADSNGDYSGYSDFGTEGEDWLRGQQISDASGRVRIQTIVPGSYPGRAVHLHVKVRSGEQLELTTQVYLPNELVAEALAQPEYQGAAQTTNEADDFYRGDTLLALEGDIATGFSATGILYV